MVRFWKTLRSFADDSHHTNVKLYRMRSRGGANVLFPPMFHRSTLLCERGSGRTKLDLYTWTQGPERDGFFTIRDRSLEDTERQAELWELFFGDIFNHWSDTGELLEGDSYWQEYTGQGETESTTPTNGGG